ncbi:uncharacterized protein LOC144053705 isoform X2 [Vanacampus margaritifer]
MEAAADYSFFSCPEAGGSVPAVLGCVHARPGHQPRPRDRAAMLTQCSQDAAPPGRTYHRYQNTRMQPTHTTCKKSTLTSSRLAP